MMSEIGVKILAIVTTKTEGIKGGGIPVFIKQSEEEFQAISKTLEKILDASAHRVDETTMLIVARS